MRFIHYLYMVPLALLTACSSNNELASNFATEHPNGEIRLSAGIVEGGNAAVTRAGAETYHSSHTPLTGGIKLALRVSGTWTGKTESPIIKYTTATVGAETQSGDPATGTKHNALSCSPVLYWDDYGTADPANKETGRAEGLTIYGAAVNDNTADAPTINETQWTSGLEWVLSANQSAGIGAKDLLISNNVQKESEEPDASKSNDGTYKFNERTSGKLLEFRHAMNKITVNLKPGVGFDGKFTTTEVKLTSNKAGESNTEWPLTKGTVNISTGGISTPNGNAVITMAPATLSTEASTGGYTVAKEALVMPGSAFKHNATIARINADGNIYYVSSAKIREAINSTAHDTTDDLTESGKNYIINVIVNKTDIVVTATVTNWVDVNSEVVSPVINVSGSSTASTLINDFSFSFYRSTTIKNGYSTKSGGTYYPGESVVSYTNTPAEGASKWSMSPVLYWPNHNTHYQFRGIYPQTVITDVNTSPRVEDGTGTTSGYQVIKVWNEAYNSAADHFPSNLQIARPNVDNANGNCGNNEPGHTKSNLYTEGICAREGYINLEFQYMMSQVEVYLETTEESATDKVDLTKVKVEVVDIHSTGDVKLGDREVIATGSAAAYTLGEYVESPGTSTYTYNATDKKGHTENKAIVPQDLTNVKFRITVTNSDGSTDVYMAPVKDILKQGTTTGEKVTPNGKWESGHHYIYYLKLSKTAVKVTATLAEWKTVTASQDVWF